MSFKSIIFSILSLLITVSALEASRIKDITTIEGNRDNQLVGYGIVIGLSGTGDSSMVSTKLALQNALKRFGVTDTDIKAKNVAAVMVTADIKPFVKPGSRIDVTVSSIGEATTLQGGVLLQTPLMGADGSVYAVAQGPIAVGGFLGGAGGDGGSTVQQNHPTVGRISDGAIVEREIDTNYIVNSSLNLLLRNPDFTSAVRVADAINNRFPGVAMANNSNEINVLIPQEYIGQETNFVAAIGSYEVMPDLSARVVINERTGTIVATSNVRLSRVAVSHGSLTITIASNQEASQPSALTEKGDTKVLNSTQTTVNEVQGGFQVIEDFPTIDRLTAALNALGVSSREMMSILQSLKHAGALQAELILN